MTFKKIKLLSLFVLAVFFLQSCSSEQKQATANVKFKLVDAPGDYEQVNVEIIDIQYNSSEDDGGWKSFNSFVGPVSVDLTTLIAGNSLLLSDEIIEAGTLNQVRLILSNNNTLLLEGETQTRVLSTPSAQQSGLKLKLNQKLEPGFSYSFILDWDVQKSVVQSGNSGGFNLKPVIRVVAEVNSGSISGTVVGDDVNDTSDENVAVSNALVSLYSANDIYVTETLTDDNGKFMIQGVAGGDYKLKITKAGFMEYNSSATFNLVVGEVEMLGDLVLSPM